MGLTNRQRIRLQLLEQQFKCVQVIINQHTCDSLMSACKWLRFNYCNLYNYIKNYHSDFQCSTRTNGTTAASKVAACNKKKPIDLDLIKKLYYDDHLSMEQIGRQVGCSASTICRLFASHHLIARTKSENIKHLLATSEQYREFVRARNIDAYVNRRTTGTKPERQFAQFCIDNHIEFVEQYRKVGNRHPYDFFLPQYNLLVEIDGTYWHSSDQQRAKDQLHNQQALDRGYNIVRIDTTELANQKRKLLELDQQILDYSTMTTEQLIELEKEYSSKAAMLNSMQMALKIVLNSMYGALGNSSFRYFNISLASSVTTSGQLSIRWIERKLNEWMDKKTGISKDRVVLIDTDSVVLDLEDVVNKFCPPDKSREEKLEFLNQLGKKVIDPYIDQSYNELAEYVNAFEQRMHMKRENIIDSMVSVAAKSYVMAVFDSEGVRYTLDEPYMKIMGVQLVKSSTPKVIQQALRDSLPILLHQQERDMQRYISEVKDRYNDFSVEQIAFPRGITNLANFSKPTFAKIADREGDPVKRQAMLSKLDSGSDIYIKGTPIHVRGSLIYNHLINKLGLTQSRKKIVDGDKIKFVYLKTPNPIHEDCIAFQDSWPTELNLDQYVDYDKMFEKTFLAMIEKMITPLGWKTQQQSYLEDFFSF